MKKKLFCLWMAIMLCLPLFLTSCAEEEEATVEDLSERKEIYMTLYTVVDEKTTEEGILRVQNALNEILVDRYKTHLILKCYTEDEYGAALDGLYEEFAEQVKLEKEEEKKAEEAAREREKYESTLTSAELKKYKQQLREEEEARKLKEEEEEKARLDRIKNGLEDPISGPQLDIFYLPTAEDYYDAISNGQLLPLDSFLKVDFKEIFDYLHPNLMTTAKVSCDEESAATYAMPTNAPIAEDGWYYVFDTELVEKYDFALTNDNGVPYAMSYYQTLFDTIAASEPGVIPIANPAPVNGMDFYNDIAGFPIAVNNSEYGKFEARGATHTYGEYSPVREHFRCMADFRAAGYFVDREMTTADNFFADIRQGSLSDVAEWEAQGYTVLTYRRPSTSIDLCRSSFYGISSYCDDEYQVRAMEVLKALYTDAALHNVLAFGVAGTDYVLNEDGITVTKLCDDWSIDFGATCNTLLGYLPEGYPADYVKLARDTNLNTRLSGFSCFFLSLDEDELEWYEEILNYQDECTALYEQMCSGVANWEELCAQINENLDYVDFSGFMDEIFNDLYKTSAKTVRENDEDNYKKEPIRFQSEADRLEQGTVEEESEEGETVEEPIA